MDITYLGHAAFKLRGKLATVVIDPFDEAFEKSLGYSLAKVAADIVLSSHEHGDHSGVGRVSGTKARPEPFIINAPGEYEVSGVSVFGLASFHDNKEGAERGKNTIYSVHMDEVVIAHLGDLGHVLTKKLVGEINGVDVLLIPVGGFYTIDPAQAVEVIEQVEPTLVIPMHYKTKGMGKAFGKLATLDDFLKEAGIEGARREKKLTVTKSSLPEDREIVVLER